MNLLERIIVACFKALDVWFSTIVGAPSLHEELRMRHSDLGEPYDDGIDDEKSVDRP